MSDKHRQYSGESIATDWYDGPLMYLTRVEFSDAEALIEVSSIGWVTGTYPREMCHVRMSRADLVKALAMLDGQPVRDYNDEIVSPEDYIATVPT